MVKDFHPFGDNMLRNVLSWVADERWSPDNQNTNATYPRLSRKTNNNNNKLSSYWERNGAFLKLKNAEIGYTYKNMRLYISGSNLLTFAPFDLWDPEQGGGNIILKYLYLSPGIRDETRNRPFSLKILRKTNCFKWYKRIG